MACYYLENHDTYHNEVQIHFFFFFLYFQKMLWSSVVRKMTNVHALGARFNVMTYMGRRSKKEVIYIYLH